MLRQGRTQDANEIVEYLIAMKEADQAGKAAGSSDSIWGRDDEFETGGRVIEGFNVHGVFLYGADCVSLTLADYKDGKYKVDNVCAIRFSYMCIGGKNPGMTLVAWVRSGHEALLKHPALDHDIRLYELTYNGGKRAAEN